LAVEGYNFKLGSKRLEIMTTDLCVLTRITNSSDPLWDESLTIIDTLAGLRSKFDLSRGIPYGWRLLKGKAARRFIRDSLREERRYQRQQAAKNAGVGRN
jgi:hypothetical protein